MKIRTVNFIQDRGFENLLPDQNHPPRHVVQVEERPVIDKVTEKVCSIEYQKSTWFFNFPLYVLLCN